MDKNVPTLSQKYFRLKNLFLLRAFLFQTFLLRIRRARAESKAKHSGG
jgi:hypothetical protein